MPSAPLATPVLENKGCVQHRPRGVAAAVDDAHVGRKMLGSALPVRPSPCSPLPTDVRHYAASGAVQEIEAEVGLLLSTGDEYQWWCTSDTREAGRGQGGGRRRIRVEEHGRLEEEASRFGALSPWIYRYLSLCEVQEEARAKR